MRSFFWLVTALAFGVFMGNALLPPVGAPEIAMVWAAMLGLLYGSRRFARQNHGPAQA